MTKAEKPPPTKAPPVAGRAPAAGREVASGEAKRDVTTGTSTRAEVADFVAKMKSLTPVASAGRGRLIFAMDATMSRQPTWDMALSLQGDMFEAVRQVGGLDVQLVYFRGLSECRASKWVSEPAALARLMTKVACQGGHTQIGRVLTHARDEASKRKVNALVYVGDAMEESIDTLAAHAGELALLGVPVFLFQEGDNGAAMQAFREIARITKGAACRFGPGSAAELRELLTAVAVYAAGGRKALAALADKGAAKGARLLLAQMKSG